MVLPCCGSILLAHKNRRWRSFLLLPSTFTRTGHFLFRKPQQQQRQTAVTFKTEDTQASSNVLLQEHAVDIVSMDRQERSKSVDERLLGTSQGGRLENEDTMILRQNHNFGPFVTSLNFPIRQQQQQPNYLFGGTGGGGRTFGSFSTSRSSNPSFASLTAQEYPGILPFASSKRRRTTAITVRGMMTQNSHLEDNAPRNTQKIDKRHFFGLLRLRGGASSSSNDGDATQQQQQEQYQATRDVSQMDSRRPAVQNLLGTYPFSVCSIQGFRNYMEDDFVITTDFAAVFDGHGGKAVSRYLRQNLYAHLQATLPRILALRSTSTTTPASSQQPSAPPPPQQQEASSVPAPLITKKNTHALGGRLAFPAQQQQPSSSQSTPNSNSANSSTTTTASTTTAHHIKHQQQQQQQRIATLDDYEQALIAAIDKVDREVQRISHWSYQGSTAVAVWIHEEPVQHNNEATQSSLLTQHGTTETNSEQLQSATASTSPHQNQQQQQQHRRTIITANVGDSRAILSRNYSAVELTRDHKPNDPIEEGRIAERGGFILWHGEVDADGDPIDGTGVYRVNGNLAISRAIGDRSERPVVTADPDITMTPILPGVDEFIVLASDGLWDVMTSCDVVSLVHALLEVLDSEDEKDQIASKLVEEALRRGSADNITVVIIWLKDGLCQQQ